MAAIKLLMIDKEAAATGGLLGDLKKRGVQTMHVDSYDDGLSKAISQKPDVLIMDVSGADGAQGWGAFLRYKKVPQLNDTCFVIVGHGIEEKVFDEHRKLTRHADLYLHKPLKAAALLDALPERIKQRMSGEAIVPTEKAQAERNDAGLLDELDSLLGPMGGSDSNGGLANGEPDLSELDRMLGVGPSKNAAPAKAAPSGPSFGGMAERENWIGEGAEEAALPLPPPLPHEAELSTSGFASREPSLPPMPSAAALESPRKRPLTPPAAKSEPLFELPTPKPKRSEPSAPAKPLERIPSPNLAPSPDILEEALDRAFDEVLDEPLPELEPISAAAPLTPTPKAPSKPAPEPAAPEPPKPAVQPPAQPVMQTFSNDDSQAVAAPPPSYDLEAALNLEASQGDAGAQTLEALTRELEQASAKKAQTSKADKERLASLSDELTKVSKERNELATKVAKMEESLKKAGEVARLKSSEAQTSGKRVGELEAELRDVQEEVERLRKRVTSAEQTAEAKLTAAHEADILALREQSDVRMAEFADWRDKQNLAIRRKEEEIVGLKLALAGVKEEHKAELAQANQIAAAQYDELERRAREREDAMADEITKREARYEARIGEMENALQAEKRRFEAKAQEMDELGARVTELMKERDGLQATLSKALMAQEEERRATAIRESDFKTEIARLEDLNRQNEERILRAYHKIKADAELRARSEKAMTAALEMVRSQKD